MRATALHQFLVVEPNIINRAARTATAAGPNACDLFADVLARISKGEMHPPAPQAVPLAEAGRLLKRFAERGVAGKYVLSAR